jgi:hypothetical protein
MQKRHVGHPDRTADQQSSKNGPQERGLKGRATVLRLKSWWRQPFALLRMNRAAAL